ncbi:MAG: type II secretion system secretin GspD [Proteobacteria bacterium]|nr:type II secretion system secretin GspD [Pseudomonadota bacterium]
MKQPIAAVPFTTAAARPRTARMGLLVLMVACLTFLAGCVAAPQPRMDRAATLPPPQAAASIADDSKSIESTPPPKVPPKLYQGTGQLINAPAAALPAPNRGAEPAGETTFNFEGESLQAVVKAILGDLLQKNYVIAPGVQGTVTLATPSPVNASQAMSLLEMVLGWNNARMIWADGRYNIVPADQALVSGNLGPHTGPIGNARGYEVRAVPLRYISATEMEKLLKPYARPSAIVNVDAARNLIVLAGTRDELANYLRTVQIFDVDWLAGMSVGVFPLQETDATHMVTSLEKVFGEQSKTPVAGMFRFMPLEGINAVLVITPQPKYLDEIKTWIDRLDAGDGQTARLYVYEVKNVKAADLSNQIGSLFGIQVQEQSSTPPASTMPGLSPVQISSYGSNNGVPSTAQTFGSGISGMSGGGYAGGGYAGAGGNYSGGRGGNFATGARGMLGGRTGGMNGGGNGQGDGSGVSITSVEDSNSILVRATPAQWESIRRAIDRLDTMPLQVHIEAQVIEVNLTGDLQYGVSWYFRNSIPPFAPGTVVKGKGWQTLGGSILPDTDPNNPGAQFTFFGHGALAVVRALDQVTNLRVLSAPSLVVRNNVEADFDSGTQIPVASTIFSPGLGSAGTVTPPTPGGGSTGTVDDTYSQVQFRQTGVSLKVKPRVSSNGMVFMDIDQSISSPSTSGPTIAGNISVDNRDLKTSVMVQSGETVVLAGLIKQTNGVNGNGIPYLSRLPVIGALFGTKGLTNERQEVLVLVTPTVIRDPNDARRLTDEYGSRFRALDPIRKPTQLK